MTKHHWKESIRSIFSSHIHPDTDEELKGVKIEIEDKIQKILKLINDENREGNAEENSNKEPLVELIEDFHKHYLSLYERYDHLTGELRQKVHGKKNQSSSSSSDSDSDQSPRVKSSKNGKVANEFQEVADGFKQELETANLEIDDLKNKLNIALEEKESLKSEYQATSLKAQKAEKIIETLSAEVAKLKDENSDILVANRDLNGKLETASETETELKQKLEDVNNKMSTLIFENEAALSTIVEGNKTADDLRATAGQLKDEKEELLLELNAVKGELSTTKAKVESAEEEIGNLSQAQKAAEEEKSLLSSRVLELSEEIKQGHGKIQELISESSQLMEKLNDRERELLAHKDMHESHKTEATARLRDLELELEASHLHKSEMEKLKDDEISALLLKLEDNEKDASSQLQRLTEEKSVLLDDIKQMQDKIEELVTEASQLREKLDDREREFSAHKEMHECHKTEATARITDLELELASLQLLKTEMEKQKDDEMSALLIKLEDRERDLLSQVERLTADVNNLQLKLETLHSEKCELEEHVIQKNSEALTQIQDLTAQVDIKQQELESYGILVKDLKSELDSLRDLKGGLEEQLKCKSHECVQLQEGKDGLQNRISELEEALIEKESELSSVSMRSESGEKEASSQILALTVEVGNLQEKVNFLSAQKTELELQLERKIAEISEHLLTIENLNENLASMSADEQRLLEEREKLIAQLRDMELEVGSLHTQKRELEEFLSVKNHENHQLWQEKGDLLDRISDLEKTSIQREEQLLALQMKLEEATIESSAQIGALTVQISNLQQELDSLHAEKRELNLVTEKLNQESAEILSQAENLNTELASKIAEQEKLLREQENAYNELSEVHKQLEVRFEECKENLQVAERKIEEITEEFHKIVESKDRQLEESDETIEDLKRELEIKGDEVTTLVENVRNIEVKLRLSNQKLRITEQLLSEKENDHTAKEEKYQQDNKLLHERIVVLCEEITTYKETQSRIKAEIAEKVNETFTGLDTLTMKFEEDYGHIETCVYEILNELQVAKSWVKDKNSEEEKLKKERSNLCDELKHEKEQELLLTLKVGELELKLQTKEDEKENLAKGLKQLEVKMEELKKVTNEKDEKLGELVKKLNEKDSRISDLEEEKKEAIRQLCIWIDYHRERFKYLQEVLTKRIGGRR